MVSPVSQDEFHFKGKDTETSSKKPKSKTEWRQCPSNSEVVCRQYENLNIPLRRNLSIISGGDPIEPRHVLVKKFILFTAGESSCTEASQKRLSVVGTKTTGISDKNPHQNLTPQRRTNLRTDVIPSWEKFHSTGLTHSLRSPPDLGPPWFTK